MLMNSLLYLLNIVAVAGMTLAIVGQTMLDDKSIRFENPERARVKFGGIFLIGLTVYLVSLTLLWTSNS